MANNPHIPLQAFREVSMGDKAKVLESFGTLLASTKAHGLEFFLYAIDNYFVEVTSMPDSGAVIYIRATEEPSVMDMYLGEIDLIL